MVAEGSVRIRKGGNGQPLFSLMLSCFIAAAASPKKPLSRLREGGGEGAAAFRERGKSRQDHRWSCRAGASQWPHRHQSSGRRMPHLQRRLLCRLPGLPQVIGALHRQPHAGAAATLRTQPRLDAQCHFRRHRGAAVQHARQGHARHAKLLGGSCDGQPQLGQYVFAQRQPRMGPDGAG